MFQTVAKVQESRCGVVTELFSWADDDGLSTHEEVQRVESLAVDTKGRFILLKAGSADGYRDAEPELLDAEAVCGWLRKRVAVNNG